MLLLCLTGRELCYWFTWIVRRALNALTDRNKTKILIFFASFVKNKDKTTTTKKHNTTKKKQTNKQKKLQRITAVKHYFKKTKSWHFLYKRIEHQFKEFSHVILCYYVMLFRTDYIFSWGVGRKGCIVKMIPVKTDDNVFSVFLFLLQFFLAYLDDNDG